MRWDNDNIGDMVRFINKELSKGRRMIDIGCIDFQVGAKSLEDRLKKEGYIMLENQFVNENLKNENENSIDTTTDQIKIPENLDYNKLLELQELIDPIKELLEKQNELKNSSKLPDVRYTDVVQKTFKVDSDTLKKWEAFCKAKKGYKMQDLTSRALAEYMERHNW